MNSEFLSKQQELMAACSCNDNEASKQIQALLESPRFEEAKLMQNELAAASTNNVLESPLRSILKSPLKPEVVDMLGQNETFNTDQMKEKALMSACNFGDNSPSDIRFLIANNERFATREMFAEIERKSDQVVDSLAQTGAITVTTTPTTDHPQNH